MTHVGIALPTGGSPAVTAAARHAEELGLDGVWSGDHLAWNSPFLDSAALLSAAAAVTERVSVGWSVMLPALRPAAWAAKQVATVQQVSRGRLQLGVGIGPPGPEWRMAGTSATGRAARTDAFLAALPDLLAGRPADPTVDGAGPDVVLAPAVEAPPLWVGGVSDAALRRAARFGAGWLSSLLPPEQVASRAAALAELTGARPRVATMVFAVVGDTAPVAGMLRGNYGIDAETAAAVVFPAQPGPLAEAFARYRDAGADTLVVAPFAADPLAAYPTVAEARELLA